MPPAETLKQIVIFGRFENQRGCKWTTIPGKPLFIGFPGIFDCGAHMPMIWAHLDPCFYNIFRRKPAVLNVGISIIHQFGSLYCRIKLRI